jgi:NADPH:quinone reductase
MKAIRVRQHGGPEVMQIEEVETPSPGAKQVLVKIAAAGVNPVDTYIRAGAYRATAPPYTPGADAAGTVESVGAEVTHVRPGDRVYTAGATTGTYAEYALCEAFQVQPLHDNISFEQGAGLYIPYVTAYRALFQKAHAVPGETVLVHGASGGVGTAAVQLARAAGLRVIGTGGTEKGRELALKEGAHFVLDHTKPDYLDEIPAGNEGRGPDIILEMLANVNLAKDLAVAAPNGRIIVIGNRGTVEIDARVAMAKELTVQAFILMNAPIPEIAVAHRAIYAGMENGTVQPIVGRKFPLADAPKAHEAVLAAGAYGKIVLLP